ncbi:alkylphosphocholine resistance protein lem3, partial [Coemansia sp. RSA 990]
MAGRSKEGKSRQPSNTAFKQQRLRAWQPLLTPKSVLPTFFIIGIIFAPIGGWLLWASERINELRIDYTNCDQLTSTFADVDDYEYHMHGVKSAAIPRPQERFDAETRTCTVQFTVPRDLEPSVFLYYRLTNFYQNHRRYTRSFDVDQLKGKARTAGDLDGGDCSPLDVRDSGGDRRPYYPCGLIANSVFNDTIGQPVLTNPGGGGGGGGGTGTGATTNNRTHKGIAGQADRHPFNPTENRPD